MSNDTADRPFVIVVGLDLTDSESSGYAVNQAARIATRIPGSHMHLLQVLSASANADATREAAAVLERYAWAKATELRGLPGQSVGVHIRSGEAGHEIAQFAHDVSADVIIVGAHHRPHLKDLLVGSTAEHVMATATCPVFVARPRPVPAAVSHHYHRATLPGLRRAEASYDGTQLVVRSAFGASSLAP